MTHDFEGARREVQRFANITMQAYLDSRICDLQTNTGTEEGFIKLYRKTLKKYVSQEQQCYNL